MLTFLNEREIQNVANVTIILITLSLSVLVLTLSNDKEMENVVIEQKLII